MEYLPTIEKAKDIKDVPMRIVSGSTTREIIKTNYAYWILNNNKITPLNPTGGKVKPMIARFVDKQFQIYKNGGWEAADYNSFWYDKVDKDGNPETNEQGKPMKGCYFDKFTEYEMELKNETPLLVYDRETKQNVMKELSVVKVWVKKSLAKRIVEYGEDARNTDTYFVIKFDIDASPSDMYSVRYHSPETSE